jgi:hypothetical protein
MIFYNQNLLLNDELADSEEDDMIDIDDAEEEMLPLQNRSRELPELHSRTIHCNL